MLDKELEHYLNNTEEAEEKERFHCAKCYSRHRVARCSVCQRVLFTGHAYYRNEQIFCPEDLPEQKGE